VGGGEWPSRRARVAGGNASASASRRRASDLMKRILLAVLVLLAIAASILYSFNQYWIHRFDPLIERQARVYGLDPDLVWSVIHEETYFRPWMKGEAGEVGLMQVTPTVAREWAAETGMRGLVEQMRTDPETVLRDPERNIQIGSWYLEKIGKTYRDTPGATARILAAYNAGPSRAAEWDRVPEGRPPLTAEEYVERISFPTTRAYVSNILRRYNELKRKKSEEGRGGSGGRR
jgi:soluble lytic murein transglycosylase